MIVRKKIKEKRVVIISDLHCGHIAGLTTPQYFADKRAYPNLHALQNEMYNKYKHLTKKYYSPDLLIVNGDCIDGKGTKSGGCELWSADRNKQCECAIDLISMFDAKKIILTFGTPYHTGESEDFEKNIADYFSAEIHSHAQVEVNKIIFDIKHHCGSSSVPYSRATAVAKENVWNALWNERGACERANVVIRSHVHYFGFVGGLRWLGITTPALQAPSHNKYGGRRCSGTVDWGLLVFNIDNNGEYKWHSEVTTLQSAKAELIHV